MLLANNSLASAPTASISTYSCLLQSIQLQWDSSLVRVLTHHNYCGNHGYCVRQVPLASGCIQWPNNIDSCFGICSCLIRQRKSAVVQGLCRRSLARSDISCVWNVTSLLLFFPTKANIWYKGWSLWWLWSQTRLSFVTFWAFEIGGNQWRHNLSLSQWAS